MHTKTTLKFLALSTILLSCVMTSAETIDVADSLDPSSVQIARSDAKPGLLTTENDVAKNASPHMISWIPPIDANPTQPRILLSEAHAATCLKNVGVDIGDVRVTDIANVQHDLSKLLSDRFTVLVFWSHKSRLAREQFLRIPVDVLGTFASQRVKVIAVNVGGDVATTAKLTGDAADKIVSLVDTDGKLFGQFSTSSVPRTYVVDKQGTILWFDIEYSQSTRRELSNALAWYLKKD